jgi:formylglycine-generating enzyme required for sulfatase activity
MMMRRATRHHASRGLLLAIVLLALSTMGWIAGSRILEQSHANYAAGLVQQLVKADTPQVLGIVADMEDYRTWTDPLLREEFQKAEPNSRQQLHTSIALLPVDASQVHYLYGRLLDAKPSEVPVIRDALAPHKDELLGNLWAVVEAPEKGNENQRLRAAAALASYDPENERWPKVQEAVANDLVTVPLVYLAAWLESFRPLRARLRTPLAGIFRAAGGRDAARSMAAAILAVYESDHPDTLADLLMDAGERQFAVVYPKFKEEAERGLPALIGEIDRKLPPDATADDKDRLAKRQANAAVAHLRMNQPSKVWPLLKHGPDPSVRSYLIHRLGPLGADAGAIVQHLNAEPDITIRRALILSIGPEEFGEEAWTPEDKKRLVQQFQERYRTDADPGLHAAAEWLLRTWQQGSWLKQVNDEWAKDEEQRQKRLENIRRLVTKDEAKTPPQWYVTGQGQTMVVLPGPVEFLMGSPKAEGDDGLGYGTRRVRIKRTFAIGAKAVTVGEFRRLHPAYKRSKDPEDCPAAYVSWYEAAEYCNRLSEKIGLTRDQWCFETNSQAKVTSLKKNYLSLTGYRLPTEAEMEYAIRAGATTSRFYGESEELLVKYGWIKTNSVNSDLANPVGRLKPNDFGLFDMHGNVWCWCLDSDQKFAHGEVGQVLDDNDELELTLDPQKARVLRGACYWDIAMKVRCGKRWSYNPETLASNLVGFRLARTIARD